MSDDLVKRLRDLARMDFFQAKNRRANLMAACDEAAARIERLEAGFRAVEKLTRNMPGEFEALNKHAQAMLEKEEG